MVKTAGRPRIVAAALGSALLLLGSVLLPCTSHATTLYKWTDENGVVHYSDQPHQGAEKIQVAKAQSYKAPPAPAPRITAHSNQQAAAVRYDRVQITSPQDGDVLVNTGGRVPVSIDVEPALAPGHQLWLTLDGQRIDGLGTGSDATLSDLDRGTHTLQLQIMDADGAVLASADPVNFTVRQTSSIRPNAQNKPAPH